MLDQFQLAVYRFTLRPREEMILPVYKGAVLRGGFGYVFKRTVCFQPQTTSCRGCILRYDCPYPALFEPSPPPDAEVLRKNQNIPLAFVIEPPLDRRTRYGPEETLGFRLVLIGQAIARLAYFVVAFQQLGEAGIGPRRAKYTLERVEALQPWSGEAVSLYEDGALVRGAGELIVDYGMVAERTAALEADGIDAITVNFLTPTRLKHLGHYVTRPDFHILVRALLRRISSLSYFYCGERWEADYWGIIEAAKGVRLAQAWTGWVDWERYSRRQRQRMKLGGLVGQAIYEGELGPFLPLLALGELVHVGKACVFGHGKYEIAP
ncbi:TPA: CRISPR system precrRNA processing endoribonuclease RAMP protein Cas6 [Candidatus Bipolaricaulota bacterium]|nr:CRISPR system precrRNA processing endoribonuclease RAMP protein Cas6 [Candidatus Bipolaricaulota bacterium]